MVGCVIILNPHGAYCTHLSLLGESRHSVLTKRLLGDHPAVQNDAFETEKDPPVT